MNLEKIYRDLLSLREDKPEYSGTLKGTCQEYCPYFEYLERTIRGDINKFEKDILVKKYYRSSAGRNKAFPEDVRPVGVLRGVVDYLFHFIDYSLESYKFLENRTRAVRLDISIQDLECDTSVEILECICRFHILYGYALYDNKDFEGHLNIEQCKKILSTLEEMYRKRKKYNEEFIRYKIIINNISDNHTNKYISDNHTNKYISDNHTNKYISDNHTNKFIINISDNNLINNISTAYSQNNLHLFFKLVRSTDYLSYCLLHTYFDKVRLKGIEIYSKCFVEKISTGLIKKMLYLTDRELVSLCEKTSIRLSQDTIDFKNKDLFETEDCLIKERKVFMRSSKMVYLGNIDYHIKRYIMKIYIYKYVNLHINTNILKIDNTNILKVDNTNISKVDNTKIDNTKIDNTNLKIVNSKKVKFTFSITPEDIKNVIIKIYSKIFSNIFIRDIKKKVHNFERKKSLAKEMCICILDMYIKKMIQRYNTTKNTSISINNLIVVTDESIFSAIFINTTKKGPLYSYSPEFIQYADVSPSLLLKYRVTLFACNKKYFADINSRYYMINKIIDTPQNMSKRVGEIEQYIKRSSRVLKSKLNYLLDNKSRLKQISIITYLIHNGRNPEIEESWIEKVDKKQRVENIEVYYEENASMY